MADPIQAIQNKLVKALCVRYEEGEARSIVRILFEDRFQLKSRKGAALSEEESASLSSIRTRLLSGEPLQYILGEADFFGHKFLVSPAVLIPRQETEELVAWVISWLKQTARPNAKVLDLGLGSGCIGISVKHRINEIDLWGIEKSEAAIAIAEANSLKILGAGAATFKQGDLLEDSCWSGLPLFDVIVSNPPYIPRSESALMPQHVLDHEPTLALFVEDPDPLIFYRTIAERAQTLLAPGGALFFECNEFNASAVKALVQKLGYKQAELRQDLSGADRMLMARVN